MRLQKINKTAAFRGQQVAGGERIHRHVACLPIRQDTLQTRRSDVLTHADFRQKRDAHARDGKTLQQALGAVYN